MADVLPQIQKIRVTILNRNRSLLIIGNVNLTLKAYGYIVLAVNLLQVIPQICSS